MPETAVINRVAGSFDTRSVTVCLDVLSLAHDLFDRVRPTADRAVAGGFARGVFVCLATVIWAIGVALWVVVHRQAPPTRRLSLHQGRPGSGAGDTAAATDTSSDDPDAVAADGGRDR